MTKAIIMFELGGKQHSADDCSWYMVAPCGCTSGVTVVTGFYGHAPTLTEDDAWRAFYSDSKEQMRRDKAAGFRVELDLRQEVSNRMLAKCPHTPMWGVETVPIPDGYTWAGTYNATRSHLVPGPSDRERRYILEDPFRRGTEPLLSLCNKSSHMWSTHWSSGSDNPTCRTCERAARKMTQEAP